QPLAGATRDVYWTDDGHTWFDQRTDPRTKEQGRLQLTRYGDKDDEHKRPPVILAPGFGMAAASFATETIDENLAERLFKEGFEVWLFDYRASICLPWAKEQFT